ncbi:MAG: hypothetical protein ORN98_00505 [Alphaproteobacteria bacterium]|nr:hypothetical protein [Alphaproteobacteria bacterium]
MTEQRKTRPIEPGVTYHERSVGRLITTAHVLAVAPDPLGIPHVHFLLEMKLPSGTRCREEKRVLSVDRFSDLYQAAM